MALTGPTQQGTRLLGQEIVKILTSLTPSLTVLFQNLIANKEETNIDELYEEIKISLDNLLNKNIEPYHFNLHNIGVGSILTETFIKTNLLPLFLTLRDLPKLARSIKEKNFSQLIQNIKTQLIKHIEIDVHHELRTYLIINSNGLYGIQLHEPALVSQIKKIINALTFAKQILAFITSLDTNFDLDSFLTNKRDREVEFLTHIVWYLFMKDSVIGSYLSFECDLTEAELHFTHQMQEAIHHIRQIQVALLDIDIPLEQIFATELNGLNKIVTLLQTKMMPTQITDKNAFFNSELSDTISSYLGKSIGFFINQLKPPTGKRDFNFLTHHLGLLPGYLDQLTQLIYSYGAGQPDKPLALNQAEQDAYKSQAIKLFFALNDFEHLFFWQKTSALAFPIRINITTLGQAAQAQAHQVHQASQELVIYQLSWIKNDLFSKMICESDKLELYSGLVCGTFTQPLMLQLTKLYHILVTYASALVDLNQDHPDLLHLDNASFLAKRIQNMVQQKNECQIKHDTAQQAKQTVHTFYKQLSTPSVPTSHTLLHQEYQLFKEYVITFNPRLSVSLNNALTKELNIEQCCSTAELKQMRQAVDRLCTKELETYSSYLKLSDSWLLEILKQSKNKLLALAPHKQHSLLIINEEEGLIKHKTSHTKTAPIIAKQHHFIPNLTSLSGDERAELYTYHQMRISTLKYSAQIIAQLIATLNETTEQPQKKHLNILINHYKIEQHIKKTAQETAIYIEELLNKIEERNYLYLLIHSPHLLFKLIPQLFHNVIQLAENTHQLTIIHLQNIQKELYKILLKTDTLELKFGLRIGLLSHATKHFLDTLFYNFIKPLDINLVEKVQLIHNVSSFKIRAHANRGLHAQAIKQLEQEKETLQILSHFLQRLKEIKVILDAKQSLLSTEEEEFKTLYCRIHPLLHVQKKHYSLSLTQQDTSKELDDLCQSFLMNPPNNKTYFSHSPPLEHVLFITKHVHAAKKGNINSLELRIAYLNSQARSFSADKEHFIHNQAKETLRTYIAYIIDKQINLITAQTHQLVYLGQNDKKTLHHLLHQTKEAILCKARSMAINEIEQMIIDELQRHMHLAHEQYQQLNHLDAIVAAITAFQAYCQKEQHNPTYEQIDSLGGTLMPKITLLTKIMSIALEEKIPLGKRIERLQEEASKESFYTTLMAQEQYFSFDFKSIKRLFLNLMHRIFNFFGLTYRPEELHKTLDATIKTAPKNSSPLKEHGFFTPIMTQNINSTLMQETQPHIKLDIF